MRRASQWGITAWFQTAGGSGCQCVENEFSTRSAEGVYLNRTCPQSCLPDWTRSARIWSGGANTAKRLTRKGSATMMKSRHDEFSAAHLGVSGGQNIKQDLPAELSSRWNTKRKIKNVLREDGDAGCKAALHNSAAAVFDKAACLSYQLGH